MYSHHGGSHHTPPGTSSMLHDASGYRHSPSDSSSPPPHQSTVPSTHAIRDHINRPTLFASGQFTGQTIRMEIHELQKADLGRKYARVDRRPLDPPPVVELRLYRVTTSFNGHPTEIELDVNDLMLPGLLCTADLFPVPNNTVDYTQASSRADGYPSSAPPTQTTFFGPHTMQGSPGRQSAPPYPGCSGTPGTTSPEIVCHVEGQPIYEHTKQTQALVGATFVQPHLIDYRGRKTIVFVFSDLAVKTEGRFLLRYRLFDIFMKQPIPITAETHGGVFKIYSTKEFPGLSASTELTKILARWGVRLNIRETERRRRKKGERRRSGSSDEEDDYDD